MQFFDVEGHAGFFKAAQERGGVGHGFGEFQEVVLGEMLLEHGGADVVGGERGPRRFVFGGIGLAEADKG